MCEYYRAIYENYSQMYTFLKEPYHHILAGMELPCQISISSSVDNLEEYLATQTQLVLLLLLDIHMEK